MEYAVTYLKSAGQIDYELVNNMHKLILDSVRGSMKTPGQIRTTQNWIGPRGCSMENAAFVSPAPEEVYGLLVNLYQYMNDEFIDPCHICSLRRFMHIKTAMDVWEEH